MLNPYSDIGYDWQELLPQVKDHMRAGITWWMVKGTGWTVERLRSCNWIFA